MLSQNCFHGGLWALRLSQHGVGVNGFSKLFPLSVFLMSILGVSRCCELVHVFACFLELKTHHAVHIHTTPFTSVGLFLLCHLSVFFILFNRATGLAHPRGEVRQMSSALLNNMSLALASSLPDATDGEEMSDEATQILFGVLDDLQKEKSQV